MTLKSKLFIAVIPLLILFGMGAAYLFFPTRGAAILAAMPKSSSISQKHVECAAFYTVLRTGLATSKDPDAGLDRQFAEQFDFHSRFAILFSPSPNAELFRSQIEAQTKIIDERIFGPKDLERGATLVNKTDLECLGQLHKSRELISKQ